MPARNAAFAEESAEVEVLFAEGERWGGISKRIKSSLDKLNSSGDVMREAAGPGLSSAASFTPTYEGIVVNTSGVDIDKLLAACEKIRKPLEGKSNEESIIRGGPASVGLQSYQASLKRVENSLSQLTVTKLRVNQEAVNELKGLIGLGKSQLQELFRSTLEGDSQRVEPLHYITKQLPFPTIPQDKVSDLGSIDSFISSFSARTGSYSQRESPTMQVYADVRGAYLFGSLQNLATASVSTLKKKNPNEVYRQGTSGIGTYASGIEGIFLAEFSNISAIFNRDAWASAFESTTRKALAEFAKTLREINMHIKSNITTDCFLSYEIMEIVGGLAFRLDGTTGQLKQQLTDAIRPIRETAKSSLPELLEDIRRRVGSMQLLPTDGAAIPFTTEVMTRLQVLTLYPQPLSSIMASLGDGNWNSPSGSMGSSSSLPTLDVGADGDKLLTHYTYDTIDTLLTSLDGRARTLLKARSLIGVFLANNIAIIDRMIRSSDLSSILDPKHPSNKLDLWRKRGAAAYLDSWREPCAALMDVQYTNRGARPPSGNSGVIDSTAVIKGLSGKDKDSIKEKFKSFNTRFDELTARHRDLAMEREVKGVMAGEIQRMVEPMYARFWDRYHEIDKGKGKYVKYDKGSMAAQLSNLG
ncbi:exocyst complex component exo70 [Lignoscripta atroalba]|nr:exocyst complex component exo70 [Lignoscripta atroalba]